VRIVELDGDLDPDEYCKERGAAAYQARLKEAKGYFLWLADRARARYDVRTPEGTVAVLKMLLPAVQRINDRVERMAIAENLAGYIGVDRGVVLESFRKAAADRQDATLARPKETLRADEKGLIHVLLSEIDGRRGLIAELENASILDRLATRRIFQAIRAVGGAGEPVTFGAVNARLEDNDQSLLAEILLSEETLSSEENLSITNNAEQAGLEYGRRCLESLLRSEEQMRRAELKAQVKLAERAGNVREALRLAEELERLERGGGARA
jgi:DNA primase